MCMSAAMLIHLYGVYVCVCWFVCACICVCVCMYAVHVVLYTYMSCTCLILYAHVQLQCTSIYPSMCPLVYLFINPNIHSSFYSSFLSSFQISFNTSSQGYSFNEDSEDNATDSTPLMSREPTQQNAANTHIHIVTGYLSVFEALILVRKYF